MPPSIASLRITAACRRCKTRLIQPEWSECVSPNRPSIFGNALSAYMNPTVFNRDELIEQFLPNLLVA